MGVTVQEPRPYEPPLLTELGTVEAWTAANIVGNVLDRGFPAGTPVQDLTFSTQP